MSQIENITRPVVQMEKTEGEERAERSLRPVSLDQFIGQEKLKKNLHVFLKAAKERKEPLDHILFCAAPGLGKTTLANIIAKEMGAGLRQTSGPVLERVGDLAAILTSLGEGDVFFIDEIHRLGRIVEEYLYPAMEDFAIDIVIDKGPSARSVKLNLAKFTLIGATTRSGLLTSAMRARFGITQRLEYYPPENLYDIVMRSAKILGVVIDEEGAREISFRSRGTPRIANRLLKRVRDYAQIKADNKITKDVADKALFMLGVDKKGLDDMDRRILRCILEKFDGGPVGINNLSVSIGEDQQTLEEVFEPFLIAEGYIQRTSNGRKITKIGCEYLGTKAPGASLGGLWDADEK